MLKSNNLFTTFTSSMTFQVTQTHTKKAHSPTIVSNYSTACFPRIFLTKRVKQNGKKHNEFLIRDLREMGSKKFLCTWLELGFFYVFFFPPSDVTKNAPSEKNADGIPREREIYNVDQKPTSIKVIRNFVVQKLFSYLC